MSTTTRSVAKNWRPAGARRQASDKLRSGAIATGNRLRPLVRGARALIIALIVMVAAAPAGSTAADSAVTQSYNASPSVLAGMIVALKSGDPTTVEALSAKDIKKMLGVVVPINDAPIVLAPQAADAQQVLVATSGRHTLLVSDQNGEIQSGDYLTISSLSGIAMKAGSQHSPIIGQAAGAFNGKTNVLGTVPVTTGTGTAKTVAVGQAAATIRLGPNPLQKNQTNNVPSFLAQAASGVTNKNVSPVRIYLSTIALLATILVAGAMIYGGVKSGITQIGRNPLARSAINRGLMQTTLTSVAVLALGLAASFLILSV